MTLLQEIIVASRNIRAELKLDPKKKVPADFSAADAAVRRTVEANLEPILRLGTLSALQVSSARLDPADGQVRSTAQFDLRMAYGEVMDKAAEVAKADKEIERLEKDIESKEKRLADPAFRSKAPAEVVRNMEKTLAERKTELAKLRTRVAQLGS
jgi:valyl-tRNA synthetase